MCSVLEDPNNGSVVYSVDMVAPFDLGTIATYVCTVGFGLAEANSTRMCAGDDSSVLGRWSGLASVCEGILIVVKLITNCRAASFVRQISTYSQ